jgi:hypothetical protein
MGIISNALQLNHVTLCLSDCGISFVLLGFLLELFSNVKTVIFGIFIATIHSCG